MLGCLNPHLAMQHEHHVLQSGPLPAPLSKRQPVWGAHTQISSRYHAHRGTLLHCTAGSWVEVSASTAINPQPGCLLGRVMTAPSGSCCTGPQHHFSFLPCLSPALTSSMQYPRQLKMAVPQVLPNIPYLPPDATAAAAAAAQVLPA
jgi:hypothetical protein